MSKKEEFFKEIDRLLENNKISENAYEYYNLLKDATQDAAAAQFTEKGWLILDFMYHNKTTYNNVFKAKDIGNGIGFSGRTISGSMRKLVTDGYVEKLGKNPISYIITQDGIKAIESNTKTE